MSPRQEAYIRDLIGIHALTEEQETVALDRLCFPEGDPDRMSMVLASAWIERLKQLPRRPHDELAARAAATKPSGYLSVEYTEAADDRNPDRMKRIGVVVGGTKPVPQGRYAIPNPNPETQSVNDLAFYFVWVGDRGGWAVYQKAGPEEFKIENRAMAANIIRTISLDPLAATQTYGRELGYCGMCGRELTNQESRSIGIGPICRGRL